MTLSLRVLHGGTVRWFMAAAALVAVASLHAVAAETPSTTDAERLYRQLRKASDRAAQMLGQRWYGLVKTQEWTDVSGKFSTTARYLEHDPDLKWVKLRAERTVGGKRKFKDVTVPLERLNKSGQSRVRQIAFLEQKVREAALTAEKKAQASADEPQGDEPVETPADEEPKKADDKPAEARSKDSADLDVEVAARLA